MDTRVLFFLMLQIFCYRNTTSFNKNHFNISLIKKKSSENKLRSSTYPYIFCQAKAILYPYRSTGDFFLSFSKYQKFQTTSAARTTTHSQKKVLWFDRQSRIFYPLKESVTCKEHIRPTSAAVIQRNPELVQLCIFQFKAIPFLLSSHDPVKSPSSALL